VHRKLPCPAVTHEVLSAPLRKHSFQQNSVVRIRNPLTTKPKLKSHIRSRALDRSRRQGTQSYYSYEGASSSWHGSRPRAQRKRGQQKLHRLRPRRIVEQVEHHAVQCRFHQLKSRLLDRGTFQQGKYEEEKKKRVEWEGDAALYIEAQGGVERQKRTDFLRWLPGVLRAKPNQECWQTR
jgi:hypothetical protein